MRIGCCCLIMTAVFTLSTSLAAAQNAAGKAPVAAPPAAPSKHTPQSPPADKAASKYFVKLHHLLPSCMSVVLDSSDLQVIKALTWHPAETLPGTDPSCPDGSSPIPSTNAAAIVDPKALGSDADYELYAVAPDKIVIYLKVKKPDTSRLPILERAIDDLAGTNFKYSEVISVPAGTAKEIASKVSSLNSGGITALPLDGDQGSSILLRCTDNPSPVILDDLKQRIFDLRWQIPSAPPTQRLFHLNATTVVKNLSGTADGAADKPAADKTPSSKTSSSDGGGDSATSTASPTISVTVTPPSSPTPPDSAKPPTGAGADSVDAAKPSDGYTPSAAKKQGAVDGKSADSTPKPLTMQPVNDTLVYSNSDGTDRGMFERNRLMAVLDLPRPEVLLNLWALQASSRDYNVTNTEAEAVHGAVTQHNQLLQNAIDDGWEYLSRQMKQPPGFFNREFYNYITQKFALGTSSISSNSRQHPPDYSTIEAHRLEWGWCENNTYCLGFTHAFEPLRPTFTNILMAIIAADNPMRVSREVIQYMDGTCSSAGAPPEKPACLVNDHLELAAANAEHTGQVNEFRACLDKRIADIQTAINEDAAEDCELSDRLRMTEQIKSLSSKQPQHERLQLNCFKKQSETSFREDRGEQTTRVGLLRAAVADFLFNYKWATQYPHSFVPYDLSQSAQELNAELNPLILAFNRDVAAFTQAVETEMECKYSSIKSRSWFGRGDETFLNDGTIGVRGISGVESIVDTVTQSFFDATKPPSLTDLVKSVSDAENKVPGVLKTNLSANEAAVLLGALNSVKPAEAKIGRQLKLDITPHALAGASSAELDVKLTAEEAGSPTFFTADKSTEDNLSRVGTHDTTTKVRVESLKLFEVSAFSAMLQRPRSKFPILPPLFEVPYFGSFISFPIPGAKVYHRSTAIVSAVIVPTAADLAYGIDFTADRVCEEVTEDYGVDFSSDNQHPRHYICHRASSPGDFNGLPLRNYHKAVVQCFATRKQTAHTGSLTLNQKLQSQTSADQKSLIQRALTTSGAACDNLSFLTVPPNE
jgi:hypothetical protein